MPKSAERICELCKWAAEREDVRSEHIALYACLSAAAENSPGGVCVVNAREIMKTVKIGFRNTYYKLLNDLAAWGFIRLAKGKNQFIRTRVEMLPFKCEKARSGIQPEIPVEVEDKGKKREYAPGVYLTPKEYEALCQDYDRETVDVFILKVSEYQKKGKKTYTNYNATIRDWIWRNKNQAYGGKSNRGHRGFQKEISSPDGKQDKYTDTIPYRDGEDDSG